jgi:hypothetical protein
MIYPSDRSYYVTHWKTLVSRVNHESEPCSLRKEKNDLLRRFITPTGILVVRFPSKKCPFGAEKDDF